MMVDVTAALHALIHPRHTIAFLVDRDEMSRGVVLTSDAVRSYHIAAIQICQFPRPIHDRA